MAQKFLFILSLILVNVLILNAQDFDLENLVETEKKGFRAKHSIVYSTVGKEYDITYHRLYWEIDPAVNYITGKVHTKFEVLEATNQIDFDFNDQMTVDSIIYHNQNLSFSHSNDIISINLGQTLSIGDRDSIEVFYQGAPVSSGFGSWLASNHATGPIISTLSEPYGAREWWPCKQSLNDKIDSLDIYIEVPIGNLAASNGILLSSNPIGLNKTVHHWSHRYPITCYLIAISVSNYEEFTVKAPLSNGDTLDVLHYCYPQSLLDWTSKGNNIKDMIVVFDSLFEIYPFHEEKYGHAEWEWGGGMEHQTMSFMGNINIGLTAHEFAHQWFGDKITCGSWEDIWLNEGFATYLTGLAFENGIGVGSNLWYNWRAGLISNVTAQSGGSVKVDDTTSVNRIFSSRLSYNKGASLLHMLRWKLGDADFFQSMKNYLQDSSLAFSYATTPDFQYHLEQQSGMNLDEFFSDWYEGQGYPTYNLYLEYGVNGDYELTVNQTQSHSSVSFFEMPIEVKFNGLNEDTSIVFDNISNGQKFNFSLPFNVVSYEFDPKLWICAKSTEVLGIEPMISPELVNIYPNPSNDEIFIKMNNASSIIIKMELLDYLGKPMDIDESIILQNEFKLNVSELPSGIYYLNVELNKGSFVSRIIVQD